MFRLSILAVLISLFINGNIMAQHRSCGTSQHTKNIVKADSTVLKQMSLLENQVQNIENQANGGKEIITIPVVVHVLYHFSVQNISDAQIHSQIDALNKDYRKLNSDTLNIPSIFKSLAADVGIEFCLAQRDPNNMWTNGITRTYTANTSFDINSDDAKFTSSGGHDIWDRTKYLNIWVVPAITDGGSTGILGYAQMPGGPASTDGVVIGFNYFGTTGTLNASYNLGRTSTHEIGHWLGLKHIWGDDGTSCGGTDNVTDTPNQSDENYECPNFPASSCSNTSDMFNNYLDYTDDACMNMFTNGQKTRMLSYIDLSRASLKTSNGCTIVGIDEVKLEDRVKIFPNPAKDEISISVVNGLEIHGYELLDLSAKTIKSENFDQNGDFTIKIDDLQSGIYIIMIKTDNGFIIKKLIKE